jgi:hypothetical protein
MTPAEAAEALATAAAYDNRTISEIAARAWAEALPDIPLADARITIVTHYRNTREWIMPADIRNAVATLRRERVRDMATPVPPETIHPDDTAKERAWVRAYVSAIGAGLNPDDADSAACALVEAPRWPIETATRPVAALIQQCADTLPRIPRHT